MRRGATGDGPETRATMLRRVRAGDDDAWAEFCELYAPLIYRFARSRGLADDRATEVRDACLARLVTKLPEFDYDPERGRFKAWLFRLVQGRATDLLRRKSPERIATEYVASLPDATSVSPVEAWERTWRIEHLRYALDRARHRVPERDHAAFRMLLDEQRSVDDVGATLGINRNQVYKAKSRVLAEVRSVLASLGFDVDA